MPEPKIVIELTKAQAMALAHMAMVGEIGLERRVDGREPYSLLDPHQRPPSFLTLVNMREVRWLINSAIGKLYPRTGLP
jgi:hypothetical protein